MFCQGALFVEIFTKSYYQMTNPKKFLKGFLDPSLMTTKRKEEPSDSSFSHPND